MKLTKGKIAKLYNKRKQTLKKRGKPKRGASKSKTFRQNKKVNLSRRSLKRFSYLGGQLAPSAVVKDELDDGVPVIKRGLDDSLSAADAGLSAANELASNVPLVVPGSLEARAGISAAQEGVELAKSTIPEPIAAAYEQLASTEGPIGAPETSEPENFEPVVETELPEPAAPLGKEVALTDEQVIPPVNEAELPKQMIEPELPEPAVSQELSELPQQVIPSEEQNAILNDAVKTIVNEIAKKVESKLTDEAPTDDGFKAFTGAVGKMGGKRQRNTRRFKLVKNKTKRSTP